MMTLGTAVFAGETSEEITGEFSYLPTIMMLGTQTNTFTFSDSYFTRSGYIYYGDLASATVDFAFASMGVDDADYSYNTRNQQEYLEKCGFTDYKANDEFTVFPTSDSIGVGIARKTIKDNGTEYTLLAIGMRGSPYRNEWAGNFRVGTEGNHEGFDIAKQKVCDHLENYIKEYNITGKIKIWITGYSRAAAVANLTAGAIDKGEVDLGNTQFTKNDLYAYTFETPKATTDEDANSAAFGNIHNVISPNDLVPVVAPSQWGFTRYGVDHETPTSYNDSDYASLYAKMTKVLLTYNYGLINVQDLFVMYTLDGDSAVKVRSVSQSEFYEKLTDALTENLTRQEFVDVLQDDLIELMLTVWGEDNGQMDKAMDMILPAIEENAGAITQALISGNIDTAKSVLYSTVGSVLSESGMAHYTQEQIEAALDKDLPLVMKFAKENPDLTVSLLANILVILDGHFGEVCASWVKTLPDEYMQSQQTENYGGEFKDVSSEDWYAKYADYVYNGQIMVGNDEGKFEPEATMTRAMFVQTLYAMAGKPSVSSNSAFSDVPSSQWYSKAVSWASANGIVSGFEDGTFAPDQEITREQMAVMLYKYQKSIYGDASEETPKFGDTSDISEWALEAVRWAASEGILSGSDDGNVYPQKVCTRAEAAAILRSFCEAY